MNSRNMRPVSRASSALVHRGPQAVNLQQGVASIHAPNAALLIDFDNVTMGIRSDLGKELRSLLSSEIIKGKVAVQRAYADWRRYPQYIVPLSESSIDLIFAPAYGSSKKNATDIRLAIDALELVFVRPEIGTFILLSGDSDFSSLVIKLKEYGKYVIGVGIRESSSDLLVQNCDEYYSYNALAGLVKTTDQDENQKWDPWELVKESVGRMKKNGDVMRSDRLKQVMQEIDASFDEKDLGMSKFSRFVQEAANKGLLAVSKLENGQLEIDLPAGGNSPVVPPSARAEMNVAPATTEQAASDEAARPRRGRRGRGGRGRDREDRPRPETNGAPVAAAPLREDIEERTPAPAPAPAPAPTLTPTPTPTPTLTPT
ncbi:MAG: NYN domain-containing protein, partial [Gemmatimonadaceae bacterium]